MVLGEALAERVAKDRSQLASQRSAMDAAQEALRVFVLAAAHMGSTGPRSNVALAEKLLAPITSWAPKSGGAQAYRALAREVIDRFGT